MGRSKTDEMRGSLEGFEASFKGSYGALLSVRGAGFSGVSVEMLIIFTIIILTVTTCFWRPQYSRLRLVETGGPHSLELPCSSGDLDCKYRCEVSTLQVAQLVNNPLLTLAMTLNPCR